MLILSHENNFDQNKKRNFLLTTKLLLRIACVYLYVWPTEIKLNRQFL